MSGSNLIWPKADNTRVPYRVFTDESVGDQEQAALFSGAHRNYLGLAIEVPNFVGPAGYIALADGEAGRLVQLRVSNRPDEISLVEMSGQQAEAAE